MPISHRVEEGEGTTSISEKYGFFDRTVWSHPDNAGLRARRRDMNALLPGDELVIPDKRIKEVSCATGASHRFKRKGIPAKYRVRLVSCGKPLADLPYELVIDGGLKITGRSDAQGVVKSYVPAGARRGVLRVDRSPRPLLVIGISFGRVGPIEEVSGVQNRLNNLGYDCGEPDGQFNDRTRAALRLFQRREDLTETGEIDDATRERIATLHDNLGSEAPRNPAI
ncbi:MULTISPECIES: peptidoglycan-binding protein [Sorangium]|uniref:peptidoglycan-binding domain-containing protein n=1 Tax=Sorangium TaxID=39643 RepID=UPI0013EACA66|nr:MULTISPECIES: peptidoglycan-binding domain-containing protein [Sorangium]